MAWLGGRRTALALALAALCWTGLAGGATTAAWSADVPRTGEQRAQAEDDKDADTKSRGGQVLKTGWWWVANQPPAETGLVAYPQQSPPNIPAGHLPVAASGGEPDKVTAVELVLDAKPGSSVTTAKVVLTESDAPGANVNAEAAKIIACPVTDGFWADGTAARWDARPAYDCDAAQAAGTRDDQGRWTFDLTGLAGTWLAEGAGSPSFALVEAVDAPESFQVTFAPVAENGIVYTGKYGPPLAGGALTPPASAGGSGPLAAGGGFGSSDAGSTGSLSSGSLAAGPGGDVPLDAAPAEEGATAETTEPVTTATTPVAAPAVVQPWYGGLPKATFLLVPFALGLAYLAMLALGPDAQPTTTTSGHGVSRALDRLRQAGTQALAGVRR